METREWNVARRRLVRVAMGMGLVVLLAPEPAEACSCLPATVESSHLNSSDAATLTPLVGRRVGNERWYVAQVAKPYKGCTDAGALVLLVTPSSSASCGAELDIGVEYLVHGNRRGSILGLPLLAISGCDDNRPVTELSEHDRDFLAGRQVCCGDECSCADGSQPVQCFVNPCEATLACSEAVACEANYCGGCNAEFHDASGHAVCQAESECHSDADCPDGWCRQAGGGRGAEDPSYECVPFVNEGGSCEGFTPPELFERCAAGLICDTPAFIADASGICRAPCQSAADCDGAEYCASDGSCDSDGQCESRSTAASRATRSSIPPASATAPVTSSKAAAGRVATRHVWISEATTLVTATPCSAGATSAAAAARSAAVRARCRSSRPRPRVKPRAFRRTRLSSNLSVIPMLLMGFSGAGDPVSRARDGDQPRRRQSNRD